MSISFRSVVAVIHREHPTQHENLIAVVDRNTTQATDDKEQRVHRIDNGVDKVLDESET